jgi:hypothetical protein
MRLSYNSSLDSRTRDKDGHALPAEAGEVI